MKKIKLKTVEEHLKEKMKDPAFKKEWDNKAKWRRRVRMQIEQQLKKEKK